MVKLHGAVLPSLIAFPSNPTEGRLAFVNDVLYVFTDVDGLNSWYPITNRTKRHVHNQSTGSTAWSITHDLDTQQLIVICYDDSGDLITPSNITYNNDNQITVNFASSESGDCAIFIDISEEVSFVGASQSASELLTSIKTVDGTGSGLDADKLDGIELVDIVVGRKNLLDNGDMRINQRVGPYTAVPTAGITYTLDRWSVDKIAGAVGRVTVSQDTHVPANSGFSNSLKLDCTTAETYGDTSSAILLVQKVEAQNLQLLRYGESGALSTAYGFWFKSDVKTGTMCVQLYADDDGRAYTTDIVIPDNAWNFYTIIIPGDVTGVIDNNVGIGMWLYFVLCAGSNARGAADDLWGLYSKIATSNQSNFLDSTANNMWFTGTQWELGDRATAFDHLHIAQSMNICERYYEKSYSYTTAPGSISVPGMTWLTLPGTVSAGYPIWQSTFQTTKRTPPTIVPYSPTTGLSGKVNNQTVGQDRTAVGTASDNVINIQHQDTTPSTAGQYIKFHWVAKADL